MDLTQNGHEGWDSRNCDKMANPQPVALTSKTGSGLHWVHFEKYTIKKKTAKSSHEVHMGLEREGL